jgi:hypothetical protein
MAWGISNRTAALVAVLLAAAVGVSSTVAFRWGQRHALKREQFHDLRVNQASDYVGLVQPRAPAVRALARKLGTPRNAFLYVRDSVQFHPMTRAAAAGEIIAQGRASCLGKAILLCSLYRALGVSSGDVRVVVGEMPTPGGLMEHAWVDLELDGECLQQDVTLLLGNFEFDDFKGAAYTRYFIRRERFCFNDVGFGIVSQLNEARWCPKPSS